MIPIDRQVQQTMGAFRGQPDKLMQRYSQNKDLIDLLALQQMKSDQEATKQQMMLSQQQQPGNIKEQREQEVLAGYKEKAGRQVGDVAENTAGVLAQKQASANANMQRQGIMQQPTQTANDGGLMKMAGGGIVGFAEGGVTTEDLRDLNITSERWAKLSEAEKQQVLAVLEDSRKALSKRAARGVAAKLSDVFQFPGRALSNVGEYVSTSDIGKAFGLSDPLAKYEGTSLTENLDEASKVASQRPSTIKDIDAAVNVLAAKEQGAEAGPPIPEDYEALTQEQIKEAQQEREEYDPTALLQTLQKQGVTPPVAPKLKPPGGALPEPNVDKSGGVASLTPAVPTISSPSETDIASLVDPILKKSGLDNLQTRENVRKQRMDAANTAFDRSGAKIKKEEQLTKQQTLNKERLDPKKLKLDAILRGLMGASGGGNFAAVGTAGMNELDKQELAKQDALEKELGIENDMLKIDLEIAEKGFTSADQAEQILSQEKVAVSRMYESLTKQQRQEALEQAKMNFEANKSGISNKLTQLAAESLDRYRQATTEQQKLKVRQDLKTATNESKRTYFGNNVRLGQLRIEAFKPDADEDDVEAYREYFNQMEVEWKQIENLTNVLDAHETMESQFGPITQQP
tara:strand:+ start:159 stop:2048 length:1890 start_codon:yes stop_codon:yes gene_type:complete